MNIFIEDVTEVFRLSSHGPLPLQGGWGVGGGHTYHLGPATDYRVRDCDIIIPTNTYEV